MAKKTHLARRLLGGISVSLGVLLLATASIVYVRYITDSSAAHVQERLHNAELLGNIWRVDLYGSLLLVLASSLAIGWMRLIGVLTNLGALVFTLMTLGASCGPYNC